MEVYEKQKGYSAYEREMAMQASLTEVARHYGFTPIRIGANYSLKEMDSIRIYHDRSYYRWSKKSEHGHVGGSQIDFLMEYCGVDTVVDAIHTLNALQGYSQLDMKQHHVVIPKREIVEEEKKEMILPKAATNYRRAYAYLMKTRGLSVNVINYFIKDLKILYEEVEHHNIVFLGKDKEGTIKYATKRGTLDLYGKHYRGDVKGNDKNYGINIVNTDSNRIVVFEASIDLMSYLDITGDYESNKLVLGMLSDHPLEQFLKDYSHIKRIEFAVDNDDAGEKALYGEECVVDQETGEIIKEGSIGLLQKYLEQGYDVQDVRVPDRNQKDWNDYLKYLKESAPNQVAVLRRGGRLRG